MTFSRRQVFGVVLALGLSVAVGWGLLGQQGDPDRPSADSVDEEGFRKPKAAPAFELNDASGKSHRLADLKGFSVIVHFWASWCPPCLEEIGHFVQAARDHEREGRPVRFVAISLDESWADALKILPEKNLPGNFLSLLDLKKETPDLYGSYQYPESYLIDPRQLLVYKWIGPQDWAGPGVRSLLDQVLRAGGSR